MKYDLLTHPKNIFLHTSAKIVLCIISLVLLCNTSIYAQCTAPTNTLVQPTSCITPNGQITVSLPTPTANYLFSRDDGLTFQASNIFAGLVGGTYYIRTKEIATGCISTRTVSTLTNPAVTTPTGTIVANVNCAGSPTGQVTVNTPTPLANFTFSIDGGVTFQASNVFSNLAAGSYNIIAKNIATGCISSNYIATVSNTFVAVAQPTTTNVNPTSCSVPNGSITITGPTPLANFEFSIDNGLTYQAATFYTGLAAGIYLIKSKNVATGCVSATALTVTLTQPAIATPTSTIIQNTICIGASNGQITITGYTPSTDYTYSLNGGAFQASNIFTGLAAGVYSLRVNSNITGCTSLNSNATVSYTPVAIAAPTSTLLNPTSCSTPNGSITITAPTPLANYEFSNDNGVTYQTSNIFTGLQTGAYYVKVRSLTTGCASPSGIATLTNTSTVTATPTNNTSCLAPNGLITITNPTPLANYTFSIDGGTTYQAGTSFPNLAAGSYSVIAKANATGCTSTVLVSTINNTPLSVAVPTSTLIQLTSCSTPNGSITFTGPTPLANFLLSIDNGVTYQAATSYTNLAAGTYYLMAKNIATGCISTAATVNLTLPVKVTPAATAVSNSNCSGTPNGSITITGPTPLTNYLFSNNSGLTFQASNIFSNVVAGTYSIVVKTITTGCISNATNITVNNAFAGIVTPTTTIVNNTSCTTPTGSITATAPLPTANYTWSIDNGATFQASPIFNDLQAGAYQVMAKSIATGCVSTALANTLTGVVITTPTGTIISNTTCATPNGSITLTGPTPLASYTFSIDNGVTFQASNVFSGLNDQAYQVIAKSIAVGCNSPIYLATVPNAPPTVTAAAIATNITDCNTYNGAINFTGPTPLANYTFSIDNGATYQAGSSFTNLNPGIYNVRAKSTATNCVSASVTVTVTLPAITTPTTTIVNTGCITNNGTITVNTPTPLANYQFSKDGGVTFQASNIFNGLGASTYNIVAKLNSSNCTSTPQVSIVTTLPTTTPTVTNVAPTSCSTPNGSITVTAPAPASNYTFSKDGGVTYQASNLFSGLADGIYNVVVKSISTGCASTATVATLTAPVQAIAAVTVVSNTSCISPNGSLTVTSPAPITNYMFSKDSGVNFQASNVFSNLPAATYSDIIIKNLTTGCSSVTFSGIVASATVIPTASATSTNPSNCITSNGIITFNTPTPLTSYMFSIDNGVTYQASNIFNSLAVGTYNLKAKTIATGCVSTSVVTATLIPSSGTVPTATATQPTNCLGNGRITFNVAAPASYNDYEYSINDGATYQASYIFNNLTDGTYKIKARNINTNCVYTLINIVITAPTFSISGTPTPNTNCSGVANGTITITNFNSVNYLYSIDGGTTYQASNVFTNLQYNDYNIKVKNTVTGCSDVSTVSVLNSLAKPAIASYSIIPSNSCIAPNGEIFIQASTSQNLFSIDGGSTYQVSPYFYNLSAGVYPISIKNSITGCVSPTAGYNLTVASFNPIPTPTSTIVHNSSCISPNGSIKIGGVSPLSNYTYSTDNGSSFQASPNFTGLIGGTYNIVVKNIASGCVSAPVSTVVTDGAVLGTPSNSFTETSSCTSSNGTINFTSPTTNYQYSINNGVSYQTSVLFTGLGAGTYNLVAKNVTTGCITPIKQQVLAAPTPPTIPTAIFTAPTVCGTNTGSITFSSPLPLTNYTFSIDGGITYQNSNVFNGIANGLYSITVKSKSIGCISDANAIDIRCVNAPAITKSVYKNNGSTIVTSATIGDILNYVIEIKGSNILTAPTLTDVMSSNQTYIANSVNGGNWSYTGGTAAWFGASGSGTATANYSGNLTPTNEGGFVPTYSNNSFVATNKIIRPIVVQDGIFTTGGDGMKPVYFKTNDCQEKAIVKNHHVNGVTMKCWNLTTNTDCNADLAALTPLNYQGTSYSSYGETVNNKHYTLDYANGTNGTVVGRPQVNCVDLNPAGNPFYCPGYPKAIPDQNGVVFTTFSNINHYDSVNNRLYFNLASGSGLNSYLGSLDIGTGVVSVANSYLSGTGSNGIQYKTIFLTNNRVLVEVNNSIDCIDISLWPNLKDCNPNNAAGVFTSYATPTAAMATAPMLNSSGAITGFCVSDGNCFNLNGGLVAKPVGFQVPFSLFYTYVYSGTKVITLSDYGTTPQYAYCYDFATNSSCGTADVSGTYSYGLTWRIPGKCFLASGDASIMQSWGIEPTGLVKNSALCLGNACGEFSNTMPDPATRYCGSQANNIVYDKVNIKNLPTRHGGGTVQILCNGTVMVSYVFPAGVATFTKDISGIAYATCNTPTVKVIFNSLAGLASSVVETEVTYTNNGRFPEVCYSATLTDCASNATNAASLGGGAPALTANTLITNICALPPAPVQDVNAGIVNTVIPGSVATNDVMPVGTTYGTPTLGNSPIGSTPTITMNADGTYTFQTNLPGVYTYNVPVCTPPQTTGCPTVPLVITVTDATLAINPPIANIDLGTTPMNTPITIPVLLNDGPGNTGGVLGNPTNVTGNNPESTVVVNPDGTITYTPATGFVGNDTLTYQVCETPSGLCTTAQVIITVNPVGAANSTLANDDYKSTPYNTPVSGNVKTNDSDPNSNAQTVTPQTITVPGKGTLVLNADGTYTFTPIAGFSGTVDLPYTTCDDGTPQACANATLHIVVMPLIGTLPIQSLVATATLTRNTTKIGWTTINEINTKLFYVERSTDSRTFTSIGSLAAAGNNSGKSMYSLFDNVSGFSGIVYYRIKGVDNDGKIVYSNIVTVRISKNSEVNIFPNPFKEELAISLQSNKGEWAVVNIINSVGQIVKSINYKLVIGNNQIKITDVSNLPKGFYIVELITINGTAIVKQKLSKL
jgi:Bacterial Ig domain/Secretion system C-terminal sorting domain